MTPEGREKLLARVADVLRRSGNDDAEVVILALERAIPFVVPLPPETDPDHRWRSSAVVTAPVTQDRMRDAVRHCVRSIADQIHGDLLRGRLMEWATWSIANQSGVEIVVQASPAISGDLTRCRICGRRSRAYVLCAEHAPDRLNTGGP